MFYLSAVPVALALLLILEMYRPIPVLGVAVCSPASLVGLFNHLPVMLLPTSPIARW